MKRSNKSISFLIFYVLLGYVLFQFSWWTYLLVELYRELDTLQTGGLGFETKLAMVLGESIVFLILLLSGAYFTQKSLKREISLALQQKNFLLSVTHELKSPLAAIKLNCETLIKRDLDKEQQQQLIKASLKNSDRLHFLVENLLMASKVEDGQHRSETIDINLSSFIKALVHNRFEGNAKSISIDIDPNLILVSNELVIEYVLINIIDNACKYSPDNALILIKSNLINGGIELIVVDSAPIIPIEERKKVFQQFYRMGNEMTRSTTGTGIGLYLVKQLCDQIGANISIEENGNIGNVFKLTLKSES